MTVLHKTFVCHLFQSNPVYAEIQDVFTELHALRKFLTGACLVRLQRGQAISFNLRVSTVHTHFKGDQHAPHCLASRCTHQRYFVVDAFRSFLKTLLLFTQT